MPAFNDADALYVGEDAVDAVNLGEDEVWTGTAPVDPLFAQAVLWYAAYAVPVDWEPADGLANAGTGGSGLDSPLASIAQADGGSSGVVGAGSIDAHDHANGRGVRANNTGDTNTRDSFVVPTDAAIGIDADDSGMWTIDFTILANTASGGLASCKFFDWYNSNNILKIDGGTPKGGVIEWVDDGGGGAGSGGIVAAFNDDSLDFGFAATPFARPATGTRVVLSQRFDRTAETYEHWQDGVLVGASPYDIADKTGIGGTSDPLGTLYDAAGDWAIGNRLVLHNLFFHRDGSDGFDDVAALHAASAALG